MATYEGGCHCGAVAYTVEGEVEKLYECNCSICSKRAALHWFVPRSSFTLKTPDENAGTYTFNKHAIRHRFCKTCGVSAWSEGEKPGGGEMTAINARCLEGFDRTGVEIVPVDGRSF